MTTTTTRDHATPADYLNERVAAAEKALREAEEEQRRLREAQRQRDRDERIKNFREDFEGYLNDPALQEALGVRFEADKPLSHNSSVTPYAAITIDGAELRIYSTGGTYRIIDPRGADQWLRLLYEPHVSQVASGILLGIAAYRQREADRKQSEAEEAARRAEREAQQAKRQAEENAEKAAAAEQPPAAPIARVIESSRYQHTIELDLNTGSAKLAVLHQAGDVELIELTPHWATDEQGHSTAHYFRLTPEQMAMLITAYTTPRATNDATNDAANDAADDDGMPF